MGALFGGGGGGGGQQQQQPYIPPKREAPSGAQLAPGQAYAGQTMPSGTETDEERRKRLLAAQAREQTILGPSMTFLGDYGGSDGGGGSAGDGGGSGGGSGAAP